ncbi:MAG TPA: hypothetical protein PLV12_00870 [Saprospiraceae bacterium]|nr:hypothetical protein [Saprospiraceae bacterium]
MPHKNALNTDKAWEIQDTQEGKPHGWIQWKNTKVCMDFYCKCGTQSHFDGLFAYHIKCPECGTVYMCNGHIEVIELLEAPEMVLEAE